MDALSSYLHSHRVKHGDERVCIPQQGPSLLGHHKAFKDKLVFKGREFPLVDTVAELGAIYSTFLITLKIDLAMVRRTQENAWKIGLAGFLFPSAVTSSLVYPLARSIPGLTGGILFLFFTTFSLSFTYFPTVAEALDELNLMTSELGQFTLSSAMLNDVIQWSFMAIHYIYSQESYGIEALLSLLALLPFTIYVIRPTILSITKKIHKGKEVSESYGVAIQLGVLVMAFITDALGTKPTTGAIILGLVIPNGPPLGTALIKKTEFILSEFLLPVFFFCVGLTLV
ncbi:cation/H(+) antiporter 15-like [Pyrus communis]|uniref:cation/H(+) antiporter 15-like n=1 Tax=Pyrus communis TaxID=23211 RepID=UPI0035BF4945